MIVAIIPAKGKSNRLPNKNMKFIDNKPMLHYTIDYVKKSRLVKDFFVSTEDKKIIDYCNLTGTKTIKRSENLCGETLIIDVYRDAYEKLNNSNINVIVGLQPDHPDRNLELDHVINLFIKKNADYLSSAEKDGTKNGAYFILSKNVIFGENPKNKVVVYDDCTNVHTIEDLKKAEARIQSLNKI